MDEKNVFFAKTVDEAIEVGLDALGITLDEAEITVLEEGRKKLFGYIKAKVRVEKKVYGEGGQNTLRFIEKLLSIMGIEAECSDITAEGTDETRIEVKTESSARVIGKHGDVLDAIQNIAGAYTNIGREEYRKLVVDCENYRAQREETLKELAAKLASTAIKTGKKMSLEPMTPYERRIIHSALAENKEVKTISEGREPIRYIVVIPHNAKPGDRTVRFFERRSEDYSGGRHYPSNRSERKDSGNNRGGRNRGAGGNRHPGGVKRGKKEVYFGTFLGNSGAGRPEKEPVPEETEDAEE